MYNLVNDTLFAQISHDPFELISLKKANKEYVYQKDSTWQKSWPLCFPIVGKLFDNQYFYKGQKYVMTGHGFFQDIKRWQIIEQTDELLTFEYISNKQFYDQYPFDFTLRVTYQLEANKLINKVKIVNNSSNAMPYNFGWHPAFICDAQVGKVVLDQEQVLTDIPLDTFLALEMSTNRVTEINICDYSFAQSQCYALLNQTTEQIRIIDQDHEIKIITKGYSNVLIWKCQDDANYICVEPWVGHQDDHNYLQPSLAEKPWIKLLKPGQHVEYVLDVQLIK